LVTGRRCDSGGRADSVYLIMGDATVDSPARFVDNLTHAAGSPGPPHRLLRASVGRHRGARPVDPRPPAWSTGSQGRGPDEHLPSTARIHRRARRGGDVAAHGARAAIGTAADRVVGRRFSRAIRGPNGRLSPGSFRNRLRRGPQSRNRVPLGGESKRSIAGIGGRSGSPTGDRDCRSREHSCGARGPCGDHHDTHRLRNRDRPGPTWIGEAVGDTDHLASLCFHGLERMVKLRFARGSATTRRRPLAAPSRQPAPRFARSRLAGRRCRGSARAAPHQA